MALPRRTALSFVRRLARPQQRRFASNNAHGHDHAEPVKEGLGPMFYGGVAMIPSIYLLWVFSQGESGEEPFLTSIMHKFDSWQDDYNRRNYLNAALTKLAADDKILFSNSGIHPVRRKVHVMNIESLNAYSPQSVQPGWGSANLSKLVAHLEKENSETEAKNVKRYKKRLEAGYYTEENA